MQNMKYLVVPPDWSNAAEKQNELLSYLQSDWEIVSACGAGEVVHYIIKKVEPKIVKKALGRPKNPQERE